MAKQKLNSKQLNLSRTSDANGWTVFDYGTWKIYAKRVTFSQTISTAAVVSMSSSNLPVGISNFTNVIMNYSYSCDGNAYGLSMVSEIGTTSSSINFTARSNDGVSRTYTGFIDITLTQTS